jgi:hypothetical protein
MNFLFYYILSRTQARRNKQRQQVPSKLSHAITRLDFKFISFIDLDQKKEGQRK